MSRQAKKHTLKIWVQWYQQFIMKINIYVEKTHTATNHRMVTYITTTKTILLHKSICITGILADIFWKGVCPFWHFYSEL